MENKNLIKLTRKENSKENEASFTDDNEQLLKSGITRENLKTIHDRLGLITLSWPEIKINNTGNYSYNNEKEKILLWNAENFRRQYHSSHPFRKPLVLVLKNEYDIEKFVSTSIVCNELPYLELTSWFGCANFCKDFFVFKPLKNQLLLPNYLRSPTHLISTREGNSFELATFLVGLLIGQGYDAYVCSGYASQEQVNCDQRMIKCPYLEEPNIKIPERQKIDETKYRPKSPPDFRSKFLSKLDENEKKKIQQQIELQIENEKRAIMEFERPIPDKYFGQRLHAWVVILPDSNKRQDEIPDVPLFIEPSTGQSYELSETKNIYLGIESVWNDKNYWVNMQGCEDGCLKIKWDLSNIKNWEHLLPGEPREFRNVEDDDDDFTNMRREKHLRMPASYVDPIEIPHEDYEKRYPNGSKEIFFKKARVELFGPYVKRNGLIESVTKYEDYEYQKPIYIHEKYFHRMDKLKKTERNLTDGTRHDFYEKGRQDAVKSHKYFSSNKNSADEERTVEYYHTSNLDGLSKVKMHPLFQTQFYTDRKDFLYSRHIEYSVDNDERIGNNIHYRKISKILEQFHRNIELPSQADVAIREFDFIDDFEINLTYHYKDSEYSQKTRTFIKPPVTERGKRLVFTPEMTHSYNPDPMILPEDFDDLVMELEKLLKYEEESIVQVRKIEADINQFLKTRDIEFLESKLIITPFDRHRNVEAKEGIKELEEKQKELKKREIDAEVNFLGPYLARYGDLEYLSYKQAQRVRDECLQGFKKLMTDRANFILQEFNRKTMELEKIQSTLLQAEEESKEEKSAMLEKISATTDTLQALEMRLNRHKKLATERYRKLVEFLESHSKLSILYDKT